MSDDYWSSQEWRDLQTREWAIEQALDLHRGEFVGADGLVNSAQKILEFVKEPPFYLVRKYEDEGFVVVQGHGDVNPEVDPHGEYQVFDDPWDALESVPVMFGSNNALVHIECL